jgi:hypothetical protein
MSVKKKEEFVELTYLSKHWHPPDEPPLYSLWMASSEVDQKFLGHFAKTAGNDNALLSQFLYRVLGLSVLLAEKLLRTRRNRRADPSRDASARQLLHHILWLSREGLVMVEQYILPMVDNYVELKVLSYKLRASFYHIFVLFHNDPPVNSYGSKATPKTTGSYSLFPDPLSPPSSRTPRTSSSPTSRQRTPNTGYTIGGAPATPPGLPIPHAATPKTPSATALFLLPHLNYIPHASTSFATADTLAESLLPGSHPIRLSVKVEYVAYLYDCLHQGEQSRRLAKKSIADVYNAKEGMDDESFEDAAELVGMLGKMMRRGLKGNRREAQRPDMLQQHQPVQYGKQQDRSVGRMPQGTWV